MAHYLYLHDSYITKFDFMNYDLAKLVVAWLYLPYTNLCLKSEYCKLHILASR